MDYVDLYQIHRWDDSTPIDETLEALHDIVRSGRARYIGASSMYTCLLYTSDAADERSSVDLGGRRIINKNTM